MFASVSQESIEALATVGDVKRELRKTGVTVLVSCQLGDVYLGKGDSELLVPVSKSSMYDALMEVDDKVGVMAWVLPGKRVVIR